MDIAADKPLWLLFFYSVPAKPTANRLKVWRRLLKAGALQLKGSVYALPYSDEHYELFQWLVSEVDYMKGSAAFVRVDNIETMKKGEIVALFNRQREESYRGVEVKLEEIQRKVDAARNASAAPKDKSIITALDRCSREFEEIWRTDFFSSRAGIKMREKIKDFSAALAGLSAGKPLVNQQEITPKRLADYQGRVWVTRKRPFIDRMASAWLIRRFIDEGARFGFIRESEAERPGDDAVAYDVRGGEFTHVGNLCTFEVMIKSFGLKDKALRAMAEVVHELDVKDGKYSRPEADGIEAVLTGIRKTARDDGDALERGMAVFEMLYVSRQGG